jgi:hypothetical protein
MSEQHRRMTSIDPAPPHRQKKRKRDPQALDPDDCADAVWIGSTGVWVPQGWCVAYPLVAQLVGEDLAWRLAMADWNARRPRLWVLPARTKWSREGAQLRKKRGRLVACARQLGIGAVGVTSIKPSQLTS